VPLFPWFANTELTWHTNRWRFWCRRSDRRDKLPKYLLWVQLIFCSHKLIELDATIAVCIERARRITDYAMDAIGSLPIVFYPTS
jgi:hypothetical protein